VNAVHDRRRAAVRTAAAALLAVAALAACPAVLAADPAAYLIMPTVTAGEREIDLRGGVGSGGSTTGLQRGTGVGVGVGVNGTWFTEIAVQYRRGARTGFVYDAVEWENTLQLAEPNEWPVDVGLAVEIEVPRDSAEGIVLRMGPLLQKDFGNLEANLNLLLDRHINSPAFPVTQLQYQAQIRYRYSRPFEFGVQAFGNPGSRRQFLAPYAQQSHRIGPVVLGRFVLPGERGISYNLALLAGTTAHSPDRTVRFQLEYEF
jgi:hypothetical protein